MKIQCDVCHKEVASVFCPADEAALCHACDRTIHQANKLAGKHIRFSLHHPTSKHSPLCDICQERRAYIFCQEDRAMLCRECDLPIHGVNEHTQKHNRHLLTGVMVGASSSDPTSLSSNATTDAATSSEVRTPRSKANRPRSFSNENVSSSHKVQDNMACDTDSVSTSSISEYLIETIPGYCMEDLLDPSFAPNGFCKDYEHRSEFQDQDVFQVNMCSFPLEAWSPQSQARSPQLSISNLPRIDSLVGVKEVPKANAAQGYLNWRYNNGYTVPSISPPLIQKCRRSR